MESELQHETEYAYWGNQKDNKFTNENLVQSKYFGEMKKKLL